MASLFLHLVITLSATPSQECAHVDLTAQEKAATNAVTFPKKMMPLRLAIFKQLLLRNGSFKPAAASSTTSAFVDAPAAASPQSWGPSFRTPSKTGSSAVADAKRPVSKPEPLPTPTDELSDVQQKVQQEMQSNIVVAPDIERQLGFQTADSPVTKPNKPASGVPLAQPVDAKTLEQERRQKGLRPGMSFNGVCCPCTYV